jgi:hypothetical protein
MSRCNFRRDGKRCKIICKNNLCHFHNKECSICFDDISSDPVKLGCGHVFHNDCIKEWFERDIRCPLCRKETTISKVSVHVSNNPLLFNVNSRTLLENLQMLGKKDIFKTTRLSIDIVDRNTAGVYSFHSKELLGTFKIS